jgi:hypothetical protein
MGSFCGYETKSWGVMIVFKNNELVSVGGRKSVLFVLWFCSPSYELFFNFKSIKSCSFLCGLIRIHQLYNVLNAVLHFI